MMDSGEKMELLESIAIRLNEIQTELINLVADVHLLEKNIIEEGD